MQCSFISFYKIIYFLDEFPKGAGAVMLDLNVSSPLTFLTYDANGSNAYIFSPPTADAPKPLAISRWEWSTQQGPQSTHITLYPSGSPTARAEASISSIRIIVQSNGMLEIPKIANA